MVKRKLNKSKTLENRNKLKAPNIYLIFSILISLSTLILNFLFRDVDFNLIVIILDLIFFAWLILNIILLIFFIKRKYEKGAIWLSILYIFDFVFSFIAMLIAGIYALANSLPTEEIVNYISVIIALNLVPLITLILGIRLFLKNNL